MSRSRLLATLRSRLAEIAPWDRKVGYAYTRPKRDVLSVLSLFAQRNSNNIGVHWRRPDELRGTKRLERESVELTARFLNLAGPARGWITTGGTESNISALWLARESLVGRGCHELHTFTSCLAHESVGKAASLLGLRHVHSLPVDACGGVDLSAFRLALRMASKRRRRMGFIVVATVGTPQTGSSDAVEAMADILESIRAPSYLHIDAALGGFVLPFTNPVRVFDFRLPAVSSISVDFHKVPQMPIGAGMLVCREDPRAILLATTRIGDLEVPTLLGSRPGATAAGIWYTLLSNGAAGLRRLALKCVTRKTQFLEELSGRRGLFHDVDMNVVSLECRGWTRRRIVGIRAKYGVSPSILTSFPSGGRARPVYTFKFMPHLSPRAVRILAADVSREEGPDGQEPVR